MTYEVEIRIVVDTAEEAFTQLPFLEESLGKRKSWSTDIFGREIFNNGRLLRLGYVNNLDRKTYFLGYKGPDVGDFANIREEWGEEITNGASNSDILSQVGLVGEYTDAHAVISALETAGHRSFMGFSGEDQLGFYAPLAVHTKLCRCSDILDDRFLIELEMEAETMAEAREAEAKLKAIAADYGILDQLIPDEPPTMLFKRLGN